MYHVNIKSRYTQALVYWQEKKRQEAAAKKAEAKKLAEEEEAALASSAKKSVSKSASTPKVRHSTRLSVLLVFPQAHVLLFLTIPHGSGSSKDDELLVQVTSYQLRQQREADKQASTAEAKKRDLEAKREVRDPALSLQHSCP